MAILGDLLVQGRSRFLQQIYAPGISIDGDTTVTGTLTLSKIQDAAGTANNSPALIVGGPVTGLHLEFDSNEIMAKATGTTTADLYINTDGGIIFLGKSGVKTQVQGNLQVQGTSTFTGAGTYSGNLTVNGTTSLKGTGITDDLTVSNNAKINGSLIVEDEIRTPKWIVDNIANLGGEFIIAPTIIGGDNVSVNVSAVSNGKYTITVTDSSITSSSFGGIAWSNSSIVKVSGTINDVVLVSVNGTMTQALNTTTNTIQFTVNSSDVTLTAGTYTGNKVKNLHIMMYKNAGIVPVGIFMTSYGESKYPYIDIYSGSSSGSSYSPTTRLGYLTGIKDENGNALTINGVSPTGWGLYTNNGYFSGTIVSTSGKIGGFTIGTTDIHNGKTSRTETTNNGVWVGTDGIGFGKGITYFSTDGTGKIGPWTLSTTYLRNGSITGATNTSVAGVYLGTDGLNISNGTAATTTYITKTAVNVGNKLTWNGTTLTVTGTVNATAGYFGSSSSNGWQIDSNAIKHGTLGSSGGYILNAAGNSSATINGSSRSNLALAIGSKFGVGNDGTLYANGANITNINASNINAGTLNISYLPESVKNENIEIGGRNLLRNTNWTTESIAKFVTSNSTTNQLGGAVGFWGRESQAVVSIDSDGLASFTITGSTRYGIYQDIILDSGTYTLSALTGANFHANISSTQWPSTNPLNQLPNGRNAITFEVATKATYRVYINCANGSTIAGNYLKLERGNKATDWTPAPEDVDTNITNAAKTAANYISADSTGIRIASASPSTQNQRLELTSSTLKMYDASNYQRLKLDSTNGVIIGKESYGHTQVTDTGLFIYDVNNKKRTQVDNNGLSVYLSDGITSIANFGEVTRIGKAYDANANDNESHMELDYHSLQLIDKNNQAFFYVSDLRGADGSADIVDVFYGDGSTKRYDLSFIATSNDYTITLSNGNNPNLMNKFNNYFTFNNAPESGIVITVAYKTTNSSAKAFTFGKRKSDQSIGAYSFVNGYNAVASGTYSAVLNGYDNTSSGKNTISFGKNSTASGDFSIAGGKQGAVASGEGSIAFGYNATASGSSSIAIGTSANATGQQSCAIGGTQNTASGTYSHAEGAQTTAQGHSSHSEGMLCRAQGPYSHAQGYNTKSSGSCSEAAGSDTIAAGAYQTVIGKLNKSDASGNNGLYAFIIGNGTADDARSNALAVNWNGTIESGIAGKGAIQWIDAARGTGAVYVPKKEGDMSNVVASLVMETSGGGAWIISNYADEYLRLSYVTGADRSAGNNTAVHPIVLNPDGSVTHRGDVGWTNLTMASGVAAYSTTQQPQYRKWGPVVNVRGAFKNNAQLASGGSLTLATLPDGCRPAKPFDVICQGSSMSKWLLTINTNGTMVASRYSNGGTAAAAGAGTWFVFNVTFMV